MSGEEREEVINIKEVKVEEKSTSRKIVCICDGSVCTPVNHTGFFGWFNCCFGFPTVKEFPLFVNSLPQQLFEKLDETKDDIVKMYVPGCGTDGGLQSYYEIITGWEVPHIMIRTISFLGSNYRPGSNDEVILFGYSRGGYAMSLVTKFIQFFSKHNEGRCLPCGLSIWNDVTPKKLVYDLTHWRVDELLKTFTKKQLKNDFKEMPMERIRLLGLMDVVPMYSNQSCICTPCCGCTPYFFWTRGIPLPAEKTFEGIHRVVHVVPENKVDIFCPFGWLFELFPSSVIKKDEDEITVDIDQYFLPGEDHLRMSNNVDLVRIVNEEIEKVGLKLKSPLVSNDPSPERGCCYMFYYVAPLYIFKKKTPQKDWIVSKLKKKKKKKKKKREESTSEEEEEEDRESSESSDKPEVEEEEEEEGEISSEEEEESSD